MSDKEMKHTPGRWCLEHARDRIHIRANDTAYGAYVGQTNDGDEGYANARLIAAAPDLLAACEAAVTDAEKAVNPSSRLWNYAEMKAAIQKARP